jgi:ATP-dependent Lon protease
VNADDNLTHLDRILGFVEYHGKSSLQRRLGTRHRVVLLPEVRAVDKEAELGLVMPDILAGVVEKVNLVLAETLPGSEARFVALGRRVTFEAEVPHILESLPESATVDLARALAGVAPSVEFRGAYLGSLYRGLQDYAAQIVEDYTEPERKNILSRELEQHKQGPLSRLKDDDRRRVDGAAGLLPMRGPVDVDGVDELWAAVHAEAPWLQTATVEGWRSMRHEVGEGRGAWAPPMLLSGDPGTGKTTLGRSLARAMGTPLVEIDAGSGTAAFQIAGLEKGWNGAEPGLLVETVLRERIANPVVIVNELCRAGSGMTSTKGGNTSLSDALLALLDRGSCRSWRCPALRVDFDLSRVSWILTANRIDMIDPALLSRVRLVHVPKPTAAHVAAIVRRKLGDLDEDLACHAAEMIAGAWAAKSLSLRQVDAMCERVRRSLTGPRLH